MVKFCDEQVRNDSPTRACLTKGKLMTGHGRKEKKTPVSAFCMLSLGADILAAGDHVTQQTVQQTQHYESHEQFQNPDTWVNDNPLSSQSAIFLSVVVQAAAAAAPVQVPIPYPVAPRTNLQPIVPAAEAAGQCWYSLSLAHELD